MADAVAKPVKMAIIKNPVKGFIRNMSAEEIEKMLDGEQIGRIVLKHGKCK